MSDTSQLPYHLSVEGHLSTSTLLAFEEAKKMGINYREVPGTLLIEMIYKGIKRYYRPQIPFQTSFTGFYIADHKHITKIFLQEAGVSVPKGITIKKGTSDAEIRQAFSGLHTPLVVKPTNGTQGQDVFMGIQTEEDFVKSVEKCFSFSNSEEAAVVVEEQFEGKEFRILATPEKVIGITLRIPANVIGDGTSTIGQLIEQKNADWRRHDSPEAALVKIKVDQHVQDYLKEKGLTLDSVPAKDERVFLRHNSNISTGGDSIDYTEIAHPSVHQIAQKVMQSIPGLAIAGIDFMTKDITVEQTAESYLIIEINASPGFSIQDLPYEGKTRNAAREFLFILFPEARKDFDQT